MEEYESVLLVKQEVFVYKIPPRTTNRGYRAADWSLQVPDWTGRMRLVTKGNDCVMKLEDKTTGELFAKCPIEKYPGIALEAVTDSSRYFVVRIQDDGGRAAFIGVGFADRGDSFDLNVALQDHFKWVEKTEQMEEESKSDKKPQLDLSFKEGQTITINLGQKSGGTPRPKSKSSGSGILPPPPGGLKIAPPPGSTRSASPVLSQKVANNSHSSSSPVQGHSPAGVSNCDLLLDLEAPSALGSAAMGQTKPTTDLWGDFASAGAAAPAVPPPPLCNPSTDNSGGNWVQF